MAPASGNAPPRRPIKSLLVANRGEIATRIIQAAREASLETYALITANDSGHALQAAHALELPSPATYLDIGAVIKLIQQHRIDAVHPGYGFLSESPEFAKRAWDEAGAIVIGPGWDILERTGDKLAAKLLAEECGVPTLPATKRPSQRVEDVRDFARLNGLPVMLKAVDGGGGKGIRLVRKDDEIENASKRAMAESPSHQVFVEKAAVDGFRHVEVQIVGDGSGNVKHLNERECSIQRRFQKIVEIAPSTIRNRKFIAKIVESAVRMAERVKYLSLGTFEFLANPDTEEFFFLEVNPRLQVEHTITESISLLDIVKAQLEIAQGAALDDAVPISPDAAQRPLLTSIQLRVTAENVQSDWSLSIGRIGSFRFPTGNGIRVDTALVAGHPAIVSADFDSLLAKIIVTAASWPAAVAKCRRALADTRIEGVKTNLDMLRAIVASTDFERGACDTSWLEAHLAPLLEAGQKLSKGTAQAVSSGQDDASAAPAAMAGSSSSTVLLRKGDAWALKLAPQNDGSPMAEPQTHHLKLTRVLRNEFPSLLRAEVEYSRPGSDAPAAFVLEAAASGASAGAIMAEGRHRRGNANDPHHVVVPFPGKLVEVLVDEGDVVAPGQVVCVVQQMKMELEVRAKSGGRVKWVTDAADGEDIAEGSLAAELEDTEGGDGARAKL